MFRFLRPLYVKAVLTFRALNFETVVINRLWFQVGELRHVRGDTSGEFDLFRHVFQVAFRFGNRSMSCKFFYAVQRDSSQSEVGQASVAKIVNGPAIRDFLSVGNS